MSSHGTNGHSGMEPVNKIKPSITEFGRFDREVSDIFIYDDKLLLQNMTQSGGKYSLDEWILSQLNT
jgi:hypothetical protein